MKQKYPKKCLGCGEYMEPIFETNMGRSHFGAELISRTDVEPIGWECVNCKEMKKI